MSEESGNTQDKKNKKGSMTTSFMANSLILTSVMYIGILGLIYVKCISHFSIFKTTWYANHSL